LARALSVGTRWALLYTAATSIVLAIPIAFIYLNVKHRIEADAVLLLDSYMAEVRSEVEAHPEQPGVAVRTFTARLRRITPGLDYGAALLRSNGHFAFQVGSLEEGPSPDEPQDAAAAARAFHALLPGYLLATLPNRAGTLMAAISNRSFAGGVDQIRRLMLVSVPLVLALSALCGAWLARRSLRPIAQMSASARRIGGENLSERIPIRGTDDELDRLAGTLNGMFDRIADAMERLRGFSADAAHQLKSPIASLQNEIEVTLAGEDLDRPTRKLLSGILDQVGELGTSVGAMLRLARSESGLREGQASRVDLPRLLDGVVSLFQPMADEREVALGLEAPEPLEIQGDVAWLRELFASLVQNAIVHTPAGGSVSLAVAATPREVEVRVTDTGKGIPSAEQRRIFDRFYRVSPDREVPGSGLGLAIAREIAVAHGGEIELESEVGRGSSFRVCLPRQGPLPAPPAKSPPRAASAWYTHAATPERPGSPTPWSES
jgi:heavy metal sensor kinase